MTVFFLSYFAISMVLVMFLNTFRESLYGEFTEEQRDAFQFIDRNPKIFYTIFVLISPVLLFVILGFSLFDEISKGIRKK